MSGERFVRARELFERARDMDPSARDDFLRSACGDDVELKAQVVRLLDHLGTSQGPLDVPAVDALGVRAGTSVQLTGRTSDDSAWTTLVEQLRSRGPTWQRYVIEDEIARGGMGVIQRVLDQDGRRHLARKVMLRQGDVTPTGDTPSVNDRSLGRFLEEAQVTGQLDHPGIVPVHEIGVDDAGRVYFTMKLVEGDDLRRVFEKVEAGDEGWSQTRALTVLLRACEALAFAHDRGVVHRDLKPANIMVGRFGEVYVMDWGLARILGRGEANGLPQRPASAPQRPVASARSDARQETPDSPLVTRDGDALGTPAYMAPEQAEGDLDRIGPWTDVYGMGAILYQLLCGHVPYVRPDVVVNHYELWAQVRQSAPEPVTSIRPEASPELIAICERAMARTIEDRYPDMTALAQDLRAYLEDRVVKAYARGPIAELTKWVRRNRALAATVAVAIVLAMSSGFALAWQEKQNAKAMASQRDRVQRLSDKRRLDVLVAEAEVLWPAHPGKLDSMRGWLSRADVLLGDLPVHEKALAEVRVKGTPLPHPNEPALGLLREHLASHLRGEVPEAESDLFIPGDTPADDQGLSAHMETLMGSISDLEITIARERLFDLGADDLARWWHDAVRDLVVGLHALQADDLHGATIASIQSRLEWAETVEERTTTGPDVKVLWDEARAAIRTHPLYNGLELGPQIGLVPLGPDPASGLWEFWHPQTGAAPVRESSTEKFTITEKSGLVFVLIPGGTYRIGAQEGDTDAQIDEYPPHDVALSPYFLSKYEMTQGQWLRFTGENPSYYPKGYAYLDTQSVTLPGGKSIPMTKGIKSVTLAHPVESVGWELCQHTLTRLGLLLPTEAQWEAACRARTEWPWWTGPEKQSLLGAANLPDQSARRNKAVWNDIDDWPDLEDGFPVHAPVGSYRANPFGLEDVHGNVFEFCRDNHARYTDVAPREGDGLREVPNDFSRVCRGGNYSNRAANARSSERFKVSTTFTDYGVGVRPAMAVE